MSYAPNDVQERLAFAIRQSQNPTQNWAGYCQMFCRSAAGVGGGFGSATAQWYGTPEEDRHDGGDPNDAPVGSFLCSTGPNPHGHIWMAARPFRNGTPGGWGTDMVRIGYVDKHARSAPMTVWGQRYRGYITSINGWDLIFPDKKEPKPKQIKRYEAIDTAIQNLRTARDTARDQKDRNDLDVLNKEIDRLQALYKRLRRF